MIGSKKWQESGRKDAQAEIDEMKVISAFQLHLETPMDRQGDEEAG